MTTASAADLARLTALIARQRRELDRMHAQAATRSVVDTAQGILMERLGCTAAEAGQQLARIAQESGTQLAELAAEIAGQRLAQAYDAPAGGVPGPDPGPDPGRDLSPDPTPRRLSLASAILQVNAGSDRTADGDGIAAAALEQVLGRPVPVPWCCG